MRDTKKGEVRDLSELLHQLIQSNSRMLDIITRNNSIMNKTKMLSLNSSIEAARAGVHGRGFSVIATEIQKFSDQSRLANNESLDVLKDFNHQINDIIGVRTADVAYDLIDKIDRNLFERNCDVQAWATFEKIVDYALEPTEQKQQEVNGLLRNLYEIYEVYYDIIMADKNGVIVATGVNDHILGENMSATDWFTSAMKKDGCSVSEMYYSKHYSGHTVSYSCPIKDSAGRNIGVLSTRFNWNFIYDILDKAKISTQGEVYVVTQTGLTIASRTKEDVLNRTLQETYPSVKEALKGSEYGYEIELEYGSLKGILAYSHTRGYNSYPGKHWSVVVREAF